MNYVHWAREREVIGTGTDVCGKMVTYATSHMDKLRKPGRSRTVGEESRVLFWISSV